MERRTEAGNNVRRKGNMKRNVQPFEKLVEDWRKTSEEYLKQWNLWLCLGSVGAAVSTITLASKLPNPNYAFMFFLPSLWSFLVGTASGAIGVLLLAKHVGALAHHFASAHNRQELENAVRSMPEVLASPKRLADEANADRNKLIAENQKEHAAAERAWVVSRRWLWAWRASAFISSVSFLVGVAWPLIRIGLGAVLVPATS